MSLSARLVRYGSYYFADGVAKRSLIVAVIVGAILNVINQGNALWGHQSINYVKLILTFMVPYGVSSYGAVSYRLRQERRVAAGQSAAPMVVVQPIIGMSARTGDDPRQSGSTRDR